MLNAARPSAGSVVILLDVDNTLLDNDRFAADVRSRLTTAFGAGECERYWSIYARLREQTGYADYLGALQEFRRGVDGDPALLRMSGFLLDYPFADRVYPHALDAIAHLATLGETVILSDGDIVFQPRKIQRSGLWDAVEGRVIVDLHKQHSLANMEQRYAAAHYVMVDDKPHLLAAMKEVMGARLTTVFVRQGHYAAESSGQTIAPQPDRTIERIGDLCHFDLNELLAAIAPAKEHA